MASEARKRTFLGIAPEDSHYKNCKVVIIPAPFEASTSYQKGTENGPSAVLLASEQVEYYDIEFRRDFLDVGIHTLDELPVRKAKAPKAYTIVEAATTKVLSDGKFPILMGGEHAISYGFFKPLMKKHPNLSIFHIDAHTDMRDQYEGDPHSHASVLYHMRKICKKTVSIGIRSMCEEEAKYVKDNKVAVYYDYEIRDKTLDSKELFSHLTEDVYLTIDVDGISPTLIPTTGTPEPGGLGWYQTLDILKKLFKEKNVVGMDVVEMMPIPNIVYGDFLIAKLMYKCIGYKYYQ